MSFSYRVVWTVFGLLIAVPLLFCSNAAEQTSHHSLYGIEHKLWPSPPIAGVVGAAMVVWCTQRGVAYAYLDYLLLVVAVVGALRLCLDGNTNRKTSNL
jgi:hypothetical protein